MKYGDKLKFASNTALCCCSEQFRVLCGDGVQKEFDKFKARSCKKCHSFHFYMVRSQQGRRRLLKISYQDHPPKYVVTSGLNCVEQRVSQSEKMAFRLAEIFLYFQTIKFVSFHTEDRKMLQEHFFDFLSKTFGKRENFSIVLK